MALSSAPLAFTAGTALSSVSAHAVPLTVPVSQWSTSAAHPSVLFVFNTPVLRQIRESHLNRLFVYKVSQLKVSVLARLPQVSCFLSQNHFCGWGGGGCAVSVGGSFWCRAGRFSSSLVVGDQESAF